MISYFSNVLPQRSIERGGGGDDLREAGGAGEFAAELNPRAHIGNAVKSFGPPLVAGDPQARHGGGIVHKKPNLLLQCQTSDQILYSLVGR